MRARPAAERLFAHRRIEGGCWIWTGYCNAKGYGVMGRPGGGRGTSTVHRVAWETWRGPIPGGLWVLHHCDNPPCFNPDHLWLGDNTDNQRDSARKGRTNNGRSARTHCPQGHPYEETDYGYDTGRVCRICKRETARRWYYEHGGSPGRRTRRAGTQDIPEGGSDLPSQS